VAISIPVAVTADDRTAKRVAKEYEQWGKTTGKSIGTALAEGIGDEKLEKAFSKVGDAMSKVRVEEAKLQELRDKGASNTKVIAQAEALARARTAETRATNDAIRAYDKLNNTTSALSNGFSALSGAMSGTRFGALASDVGNLTSKFGGAGLAIGGAVAGFAALAVGATELMKALYNLGEKWDSITDSISLKTGKMGDDLNKVVDQVAQASLKSSNSLENLGRIGGQLSATLGAGQRDIADLIVYVSDLDEATGQQTNIQKLTQMFHMFNVSAAEQIPTINKLYTAYTTTQIPINDLIQTLLDAGPKMQQIGLDFSTAAGLVTTFVQSGVDQNAALNSLSKAIATIAKAGGDVKTVLPQAIAHIKQLHDEAVRTGDVSKETAAQQEAIALFGTKAYGPMLTAIEKGAISGDQLNNILKQQVIDLHAVKESTDDGLQGWEKMKHMFEVELKPASDMFFNAVNRGMMNTTVLIMQKIAEWKAAFQDFANSDWLRDSPIGKLINWLSDGNGNKGGGGGGSWGDESALDTGPGPNLRGQAIDQSRKAAGNIAGAARGAAGSGSSNNPFGSAAPVWDDNIGAGGGGKGPGPQVPYPSEYTAGARPGESEQQYRDRISKIEADHKVAQAQADIDALKAQGASADELQKAENDLAKALQDRQQNELRIASEKTKTQGSSIAVPYDPAYGQGPQPGESTAIYGARMSVLESQHKVAEEKAQLDQLEASGVATQNDIVAQKNKLLEAQQNQQQAEMRLNDAYRKQAEDLTKGLDTLGAGLDKDLGLSKGLAGLADNLVRFLGNLAAAPILGPLNAMSAAMGGPEKTGVGLIAMAYDMANGGAASQPASKITSAATAGPGAATSSPRSAAPSSKGGWMGDAALLANVNRSGHYDNVTKDLSKGLVDCASGVEDLVNIIDGKSTVGGSLWTGNAASVLPGMGFQRGMGGPGDFRIGYRNGGPGNGHMQATLPDGTNVNFGSTEAIQSGGLDGGAGAFDPSFTDHWYRPVGASSSGPVTPGGSAPTTTSPFGSIPIPLPVTIVGGIGGDRSTPGGPAGSPTPGGAPSPGGAPGGAPYNQLTPEQLTNPGLTNPTPSSSGGSIWGVPVYHRDTGGGIGTGASVVVNNTGKPETVVNPQGMVGDKHVSELFPGPGSGNNGQGSAAGSGPSQIGQQGPTEIGGAAPDAQSGASTGGGGGVFGSLVGAGAAAADAFAPGSGAAVQIAGQEIQRAIKAGGQLAGIAAGGLMETFLPTGGSEIANDNWITRIGGAFAGVAPQLPNLAGKPPTPVPPPAPAPSMPIPDPGVTNNNQNGPQVVINNTLNSPNHPIDSDHVQQLTQAQQDMYQAQMPSVSR